MAELISGGWLYEEGYGEFICGRISFLYGEGCPGSQSRDTENRIFGSTYRLFRTEYLKKLREFLLSRPEADPKSIIDIPLYIAYDGELRKRTEPTRSRIAPHQNKDMEKIRFTISVVLNVLLAVAILCMFYISYSSEQPNITNYERILLDRYASWEQELTEREQMIREKEKELQIHE